MNTKLTGRFEDWWISGNRVHGNMYGDIHGRFNDGEYVVSSTVYLNASVPLEQHDLVTTRNSVYVLGVPRKQAHDK